MHDSRRSSIMGSENGSSSLYSSVEGINAHGLASVYSSYEGTNSLYFPDRSIPEIDKLKGHPYGYGKDRDADHSAFLRNATAAAGIRLSDTHMASRRAEEAANRRTQAALWLQDMVGSLSLPSEPSEEDLRLCLQNGLILCRVINRVQPCAVPKVVENPVLSNQLDRAQSAYQYFENVRNFLVAVEDMGLPSFEASDLEQGSMSPSSSAKLVDCILALKSYHDWKQGGALGFWRLKSPNHPTGHATNSSKYLDRSKSLNMNSNVRRKWALPDQESLDDSSLSSSPDRSANSLNFDKDSRTAYDGILPSGQSGQKGGLDGDLDELASNLNTSASTSTWLQHIGHKFREVLQVKARRMQDLPTATATENYGINGPTGTSGTNLAIDNAPSQSLLSLISAILGDKPAEEVPMLVEFMLRKVMEEFERHLLTQRKQVTKMKSALKDILVREEKLASQNMVLEALAAGTQEEIKTEKKQMEEEKRVKEEEVDRLLKESEEKQMAVQVLKSELDYIKRLDEEHLLRLENQKREIEMESIERIRTLEVQLQDSQKKMQDLEINTVREMSSLRQKDAKYQTYFSRQAHEYKDLRWAQLSAKEEVLRMQMDWRNQCSTLEEQLQGMARAASGYHKVLAENRMLYNEVQDLKGNIRVYCRVRPFLTDEAGRQTTVDYIGENGELILVNPSKPGGKDSRKSFTFNKCFGTNASQEEVFLDTQPLIRSVLDGFNVCIFAYGQTGSGKTFTMSGPNNMTPANWGVNYRALHDLFHMTQSRLDVFRYDIGVQMLEIYNEQVRDLLAADGVHKKLEIRNNSQLNGLNVPDASMMPVRSTEDVLELMRVGQKNRAVGATALNERSSRSHSVLTVHVQGTDLHSGAILRGSLHLVDLAGSERVDRSEATGDRLKEAQHINKSLSALGDVIAALAQKNGHVPYRNSKLTQLLQDSLGGQAKTLMFVHISPDMESFGETVSTLKFAERVSTVELGAARSNKESGEIQNLKDQVAQLREAAGKKDAEIASLQSLKDRVLQAENNMCVDKVKFKPANPSSHARRMSTEPSASQRNRRVTLEVGSGTTETRQSTRKLPGRPKPPSSLVLSISHDSEDPTEHFASSSACSPLSSPTEHKASFEVSEDGVNNINEKLKILKTRRNGNGNSVGNGSTQNHILVENENTHLKAKQVIKQQEAVLAHHGEIIMHDTKYLSSILGTSPPMSSSTTQEEAIAKDWHDRSQHSGDESVSFSQEDDKHQKYFNGGRISRSNGGEADAGRSTGAIQNSSQIVTRLKPPSNGVYSSQQNANGYFEPSMQEAGLADGQENRGVVSKRSSYMLNDVVLDDHFENDGIFDLRDGYQDDSASLFSESGLSVEADFSSLNHVDQNKKMQSSSGRPHHERKALLQTQVPRPPVKTTRKISPVRADRKSLGGQAQTRPHRYTNVGIAASTDKPPKRTISLGGNSNPDSELSGNRRVAMGASSSASWR